MKTAGTFTAHCEATMPGPEEVYPYEAARTLEVLLESTPSYSFQHGFRKILGLLRRDARRSVDRLRGR